VFTRARHWSLSRVRWNQFTPSHYIFLRYILILSSCLRLGLSHSLLSLGFPTKMLYTIRISSMRATWTVHLILLDLNTLVIFSEAESLNKHVYISDSAWHLCCVWKWSRLRFSRSLLETSTVYSQRVSLSCVVRLYITLIKMINEKSSSAELIRSSIFTCPQ